MIVINLVSWAVQRLELEENSWHGGVSGLRNGANFLGIKLVSECLESVNWNILAHLGRFGLSNQYEPRGELGGETDQARVRC